MTSVNYAALWSQLTVRYEVASVTILLPSRRTALSPTTARAGQAHLGYEIAFDMHCVDLK